MIHLLLIWVFTAGALLITSRVIRGFHIVSFKSALLTSVVLGFLNMILRPLLILFTLPINILTLGLFTFVINALILIIAAKAVKGFRIDGWGPAILGSLVLAICNIVMHVLLPK
jgi:putative membrane protein